MKTKLNFWKTVIPGLALLGVMALSSCHKDHDKDNNNNTMYTISGNASGSQMVPSVAGSGTGTITGTYNANTRTLDYTSTWANLSGAPTTAGFYNGGAGTAGTLAGTNWSLGSGLTGTGTFTGSTTLTQDQANQLTSGNWYYSYGTSANPNGEVRGQITSVVQ